MTEAANDLLVKKSDQLFAFMPKPGGVIPCEKHHEGVLRHRLFESYNKKSAANLAATEYSLSVSSVSTVGCK